MHARASLAGLARAQRRRLPATQNYHVVVAEMLAGGEIDGSQLPAGFKALDPSAQAPRIHDQQQTTRNTYDIQRAARAA